ncbi:YraN family protein [Sulfuriferula sp. AH1]|uniref:YraN family protein n=1 Tax=Sulfuriferula sp. AH1 TaxID=1985873 RepID=UPI000B3B93D6|nr:YraN family protein [Sulfuriferula sp. AH1]ARU30477.1 YraN family protein [Sulfuriferula sp. AH1]
MVSRGAAAEQMAADYLARQGLTLVERNFRCRLGEIDLIMRDGQTLVFVEVRQRASRQFGGAAASIDSRKQQKLVATAQLYLAKLGKMPPCRFDAVLMQGQSVQWIRDAFGA